MMDWQTKRRGLCVALLSIALASLACVLPTDLSQSEEAQQTPVPLETSPTPAEQPETSVPTMTPETGLAALRVVYNRSGDTLFEDSAWVWTEGGTPVQVSTHTGVSKVAISDDGQVVAYVRGEQPGFRDFELWAVNADGTDERLLVGTDEFKALLSEPQGVDVGPLQLAWLPGTHTLAYNTNVLFNAPGSVVNDDLRLVNVDTLEKSVLLEPGTGGLFYFSPDGSQIALVTPTSISLVNMDGSNRRESLLTFPVIGIGEGPFYAKPVWAPDSSRLLVAIPPEDLFAQLSQGLPSEMTLWEIPVDGSPARELGRVLARPLIGPSFSPDLGRMAFLRFEGGFEELHIANADGGGDVVYDEADRLDFLGWAPDSQRFLYLVGDTQLRIGRVASEATLLGDAPIIPHMGIQWVDNDRFLYAMRNGTDQELWLSGPSDVGQMVASMNQANFPAYDFTVP